MTQGGLSGLQDGSDRRIVAREQVYQHEPALFGDCDRGPPRTESGRLGAVISFDMRCVWR
eukprot:998449-Rhodomonas_salina.1